MDLTEDDLSTRQLVSAAGGHWIAVLRRRRPVAATSEDDRGGGRGDAKKGGTITIAQTSQPDYLDPALQLHGERLGAAWLVYTAAA